MGKGKSQRGSGLSRFLFYAVISLLAIAAVVVLIYFARHWISDTSVQIIQTFGWGLILIALAVLIILVIIFAKPILLIRYLEQMDRTFHPIHFDLGNAGVFRGQRTLNRTTVWVVISAVRSSGTSTAIGILIVIAHVYRRFILFHTTRFFASLSGDVFMDIQTL